MGRPRVPQVALNRNLTQRTAAACAYPAHLPTGCNGLLLHPRPVWQTSKRKQRGLTQPTCGMGCAMGFFSASRTAACESGSGQQCGCTPMFCSSCSMASQLQRATGTEGHVDQRMPVTRTCLRLGRQPLLQPHPRLMCFSHMPSQVRTVPASHVPGLHNEPRPEGISTSSSW